jgi:hypothetical protein
MSSPPQRELANLVREYTSAVLRHAAATAKRMSLEASELAALEHLQGHVERTPNPEDRRSALVLITKAGLEESLRHLWPYIEDMKGVEEGFSEEERAVIERFLREATQVTHRAAAGVDE